jgi:hypothetical protein
MKEIILSVTLLISFSSFANSELSKYYADTFEAIDEVSIHDASLKADLWSCDSEKALKSLFESQSIDNTIGCEDAISNAQTHMTIDDIEAVLIEHVEDLKVIQIFQEKVRKSSTAKELVEDVKILMENFIDEVTLSNHSDLNDEEMILVNTAFSIAKKK